MAGGYRLRTSYPLVSGAAWAIRVRIHLQVGLTSLLKCPLIRENLKVIQHQSQEADNTFITSDGTSPYNSTRQWAVKRHYREDNN